MLVPELKDCFAVKIKNVFYLLFKFLFEIVESLTLITLHYFCRKDIKLDLLILKRT